MRKARGHSLQGLARALAACAALALCALLAACSQEGEGSLTMAGSTTVLPTAEIAAEGFEAKTGTHVLVSGLGSSAGIEAALNGTADIASSSRQLTAEESEHELVATVIAHDGIAVIFNEDNPVRGLTLDQLRDVYAGRITNWSQLGGPDLAIQLVNRDEASGTRAAFRSIVMRDAPFDRSAAVLPGTGQVRDVVSRTPGAIGYISIGFVESDHATTSVRTLAVDGVEATVANVEDGTYPISRDPYFFTNGDPKSAAYDYIMYVLSPDMAQPIEDAGYIPVNFDASRGGGTR